MTEELKTWILAEYRKGVLEGAKIGRELEQGRINAILQARIDGCTLHVDEPCVLCNENFHLLRQIQEGVTSGTSRGSLEE